MSKANFHGKSYDVRPSGKTNSKDFNGQGEGSGSRIKYAMYTEFGEKVAAVVPNGGGSAQVIQNGTCVGSVKFDPSND